MKAWRGALVLPVVVLLLGAAPPHRSFDLLVTGNGYGAAAYDVSQRRLTHFLEHIYRFRVPGEETRDWMFDAYFGLRAGGENLWLTEAPIEDAGYVEGSGVFRVLQRVGGREVESYYFSPFSLEVPALVMLARVGPGAAGSLWSLHNLHMGEGRPEPGAADETVERDGAGYLERGAAGTMRYQPIGASSRRGASPENPFPRLGAGQSLEDNEPGRQDDAVVGFQFPLGEGEQWAGVVMAHDIDGAALDDWISGRDARALLDDELEAWRSWRRPAPEGLTSAQEELWAQSAAVLRMGQVREAGRGHGQLLASLPPGTWNIAWVRDQAYAAVGLARAGYLPEAEASIDFVLGAEAGHYEAEVGFPYRVSVTRYFGAGIEESDSNQFGPNIEFDGFGLFLWQVDEWLHAGGDAARLDDWWPALRDGVAEVLVALIENETGLIAADSSIWEVHWDGQQKRFAYTSLAAVRGLCAASRMAELVGETALVDRYRGAAVRVRDALLREMLDARGALAQSYEELTGELGHHDAAVVEALNWDVLPPAHPAADATLDMVLRELRPASGRGFFRNDDGDAYDSQEWVFIDLRAAAAFERAGRTGIAEDLTAWIEAQAAENFNLIAELHDAETAAYDGQVPMVGFGAGAWMIARSLRLGLAAPGCALPAPAMPNPSPLATPQPTPRPTVSASVIGEPEKSEGDSGCAQSQGAHPVLWLCAALCWHRLRRRDA